MSTDADYADAHRVPPIPPQPPRRPATPDEDPQTTVLRPVPADPSVPPPPAAPPATAPPAPSEPPRGTAPAPQAAAPAAPPRPTVPPPVPPRPRVESPADRPAAPQAPAGRPASFRDTAAFHLANSQELWGGGRDSRPAADPQPAPRRSAAPPAGPGAAPPPPAPERPTEAPWPRTPLPPQGVAPAPGMPGMPAVPPSRPSAGRGPGGRVLASVACLVLGVGLVFGAFAGSWLTEGAEVPPTAEAAFDKGHDVWHATPVDTLFPRVLNGLGLGPGGADRRWTRIAVAPDSGCTGGFDPQLAKALAPAGCGRLLRATYLDATRSHVITVGALTTKADRTAMLALNTRFSTGGLGSRTDLMPLPYAAKGTPAADFGPDQRTSWTVRILTDVPVVVYAVSGFADGRKVTDPQSAEEAVREGVTTAPGESGLGHDAKNIADRVEAAFRKAAGVPTQATEESP
ncbi:hypothetical protein QOM21_29500 [Streptomyces sp. Pv4-95]|uniref:hypothetical protein n=1 Tax=Streptomyces sp. Pv4-95 TaxID=3049543 RepID=UPI00389260E3